MGTIAVVYDTNVLVSGIGFGGKPWQCLVEAFVGDVEFITSEAALKEFQRVLGYDHLPFTPDEQERFPELIRAEACILQPDVTISAVDEDPDDNIFLECAVAGDVTYLVSGDPHLTELGSYADIPIVDPSAFLSRLADRYRDR